MAEARSGGVRLRYTVDGPADGLPLLLSNSLGSTLEMWDPVLPAFSERFRVIRYDQRGHGGSDVAPGEYRLDSLGGDALAVLDAAGVGRAPVAGISLGGLTALWLAIQAPERIDRIVLANTGAQIGTAALWNERIAAVTTNGMGAIVDGLLGRWFTPAFRRDRPDVVATFRRMIEACPVSGYTGCCAAVRDADLRAELGRVHAPTLVIVGTADVATPPSLGELLQAGIPGAMLVALEAAHLSNVERADEFARAVTDFLDRSGADHG
ncbi:MAG: 3-oxoadipate enol-lactonase [Gemmatimonadales bacterium]